MWVVVADSAGRQIDYIRLPLHVAPPFEATALQPQELNDAAQPLSVSIKNISTVPVSGKARVEVTAKEGGTAKLAPVEQAFEPIEAGKTRLVTLVVPHLDLLSGEYTARLVVTGNSVDVPAQADLSPGRYSLVPGKPQAKVHCVGNRCLMVEFNETVQLAGKLQASLAGGTAIERSELMDGGRYLMIVTSAPLKGDDALSLKGIVDVSKLHEPLEDKPLKVQPAAWPSDRGGLVFLWEDARSVNGVFHAQSGTLRQFRIARQSGPAAMDRYGRMAPQRGRFGTGFFSQTGKGAQFADVVAANAFTLEATIQPTDLTQSKPEFPARIVNCSAWHDGDWMFMLGQQKDRLLFSIRTTDNFLNMEGQRVEGDLHGRAPLYEIATLSDTQPHHVVVTYVPGHLIAYMDGQKCFEKDLTGNLQWGFGELCFGDNHNGGRHGWLGALEGVAMYSRALGPDEVKDNAKAYLKKVAQRKTIPRGGSSGR